MKGVDKENRNNSDGSQDTLDRLWESVWNLKERIKILEGAK